jgi:hypothetical protein
MSNQDSNKLVPLPLDRPIWGRVFSVAPLVIVGSKEENGEFDLAPKHMAMPLGLGNYFCFVCTPQHNTYHNIRRHGVFTVSYPRVGEVVYTSLAAAPRAEDQSKPSLLALPTMPASKLRGSWSKVVIYTLNASAPHHRRFRRFQPDHRQNRRSGRAR